MALNHSLNSRRRLPTFAFACSLLLEYHFLRDTRIFSMSLGMLLKELSFSLLTQAENEESPIPVSLDGALRRSL